MKPSTDSGFQEVTMPAFYQAIGKTDAILETLGQYPYRCLFRDRNSRRVLGASEPQGGGGDRFYLSMGFWA
jgi:hypothetical protein